MPYFFVLRSIFVTFAKQVANFPGALVKVRVISKKLEW